MFTGIVKDIGVVIGIEEMGGGKRLYFTTEFALSDLPLGASVACSGACLSIVSTGEQEGANWFAADLSPETLDKTIFSNAVIGQMVNLELPVRAGDVLDGHIVTGHIDGVAEVIEVAAYGENRVITFRVPSEFSVNIATKGSVTINGVSLTVNEVRGDIFNVNIIPITCSNTNLGDLQAGDKVNFEVDIISRYIQRIMETR
jgi:riboflavin synthase